MQETKTKTLNLRERCKLVMLGISVGDSLGSTTELVTPCSGNFVEYSFNFLLISPFILAVQSYLSKYPGWPGL